MRKRVTKTCGIYRVVSPSGKTYIGQSVCIEERFSRYKTGKCHHQRKLHSSILKHGWSNHEFYILHLCPKEELDFWEKLYIAMFDSTNEYGLNIRSGGNTPTFTEESKKRMSESTKGQVAWNKGKKGVQKAWNKGLIGAVAIKSYELMKDNQLIKIDNLKIYCVDNKLSYSSMVMLANHGYPNKQYGKNYYRGYSNPNFKLKKA